VGTGEAVHRFDLQIRARKSRIGADNAEHGVRAVADSTLPLSKGKKPPQEKGANKS
jgi:hypothetical protein